MIQWAYRQMKLGEMVKPFYLPVSRDIRSNAWNCYIFPVAPFVLMGDIVYRVFMNVWYDLMRFLEVQTEPIDIKRKQRKVK